MIIHIGMHDEEWRIVTYPGVKVGMYAVSSYGRLKNVRRNRIMTLPKQNKHGYRRIILQTGNPDKPERMFSIHRLVAYQFIPNPNNYPEVNHILPGYDGKGINDIDFLEWCTKSENIRYAIKTKQHWSYIGEKHQNAVYSNACRLRIMDMCAQCKDNDSILTMIYTEFPEYNNKSRHTLQSLINKIRRKNIENYTRGLTEGSTTIQMPR